MANIKDTGRARLYADMHRLLATLMQRDISDPRLEGICITRLEAIHGGQHLRVLVHKPGETEQQVCVHSLNRLSSHFMHELRRAMPRRRLPGLRFCWDDSIDAAANVTHLLGAMDFKT